ncbi:MAG TPA: ABC transporter permease [Vicinamibacteria bacterium]|jgi:ABC-type polysaccharide/polyol phosphate export permease|nr:ABC transporter permease [Vicinamibacteria bacterium]
MIAAVQALVRYRALVRSLVSRELKARYRGSVLGFLWSFVNPLLVLLTYTLVFTVILPNRQQDIQPYFLFLFCGILPWTWFQASLAESSGVIISSGNLIKKVLFPAEVLPTVTVLANLAHFLLGLPILLAFLAWKGRLAWTAVLLPLPIAVQLVLTVGLALFLSALTVHFRDIQNILTHVLHLWFFATPVIYSYAAIPEGSLLRRALRLNPMTHVMVTYQQVLFHGNVDHWRGLFLALLVGLVAFAVGAFLFDRLRDSLPEEV